MKKYLFINNHGRFLLVLLRGICFANEVRFYRLHDFMGNYLLYEKKHIYSLTGSHSIFRSFSTSFVLSLSSCFISVLLTHTQAIDKSI